MAKVIGLALATLAACADAAATTPACKPDARFDTGTQRTGRYFKGDVASKSQAEVEKLLGEPGCRSVGVWRYHLPRGCSYEKTVVSLWFRNDRVERVNAVDIVTGQHCE